MSYFAGDASIKLEELGSLKVRSSNQIKQSRFSIGFECLDRKYFDLDRVYDKLAKTGVKYARCQTGWNRCETKKGVYDFAWLDSVVDNLRARGIEPWFNVGFGDKLYMPDAPEAAVGYCPINYGAEALEAWKNYIGALAKHFKGRVAGYELWNEPNIRNFWAPKKPDPKEYAKFVNITAQEILKEDATAKIGACVFRCSSFSISKEGYTVSVSKLPISNYPLLLTDFDAVKDIITLNLPDKKIPQKVGK